MFNPFICGNIHHQDQEDDDMEILSPKRSSKRTSLSRTKDSKNPYANRGLDKFSALLSDLEDKKQKIYTQLGHDDVSIVRFVFSNSNSVKPIVVKLKDKSEPTSDTDDDKQMMKNLEFVDKETTHEASIVASDDQKVLQKVESKRRMNNKKLFRNLKLANFKKPSYYLPLAIILILVFLAIFGKSFAILCTSIGWYIIPIIKGASRRPKRNKEYVRKLSEKIVISHERATSPRSVMNGPTNKLSAGKHGQNHHK